MFFVLDENKNLVEAYSKEDVLALLEQAIADGDLSHIEEDSAFVSKFKSLINGSTHHIEFVTQAQYNAMEQAGTLTANTYYFITDDTTADDLETAVSGILQGTTAVPNAQNANNAAAVNNVVIRKSADKVYTIDGHIAAIQDGGGEISETISSTSPYQEDWMFPSGVDALTEFLSYKFKVVIQNDAHELLEFIVKPHKATGSNHIYFSSSVVMGPSLKLYALNVTGEYYEAQNRVNVYYFNIKYLDGTTMGGSIDNVTLKMITVLYN